MSSPAAASRNQDFEWFSAWSALGWAAMLAMPGDTLTMPKLQAFQTHDLSEIGIAVCMAIVGAVWMMGLLINGRWHRSPLLRCGCALLGALAWGNFAALFLITSLETGAVSSGVPIYGLMSFFAVRAACMSLYDWKKASDERHRRLA